MTRTNQRRGLRNSALSVRWTHGAQLWSAYLLMCVPLWKFTSRAHQKFILRHGGALHMYLALRLFNLHLWSALLQFNFHPVFTYCEWTKKIVLLQWSNRKLWNCLPSTSLGLIFVPVCLSGTCFWWHCPFNVANCLLLLKILLLSVKGTGMRQLWLSKPWNAITLNCLKPKYSISKN